MLSFIADLEEERLHAAARSQHTLSAAALYRGVALLRRPRVARFSGGGQTPVMKAGREGPPYTDA